MQRTAGAGPLALLVFLCASLGACQTGKNSQLIDSSVATDLSIETADVIADDLVRHFVEYVGPGMAPIQLAVDGSPFAQAIETSLRGTGYAIVSDGRTNGGAPMPMAYSLDPFEDRILARLSTPSIDLTRMYERDLSGARPISPMSVMQRRVASSQ